jgi:phage terminase large subunit GpA-like protein
MRAARETVAENEEDNPSHITACFDGTWQKRGHTALNGVISATCVDRGKVLDIEIMSKFFLFVASIHPPNMSVKRP